MSFLRRRGLLVIGIGLILLAVGVALVLNAREDDGATEVVAPEAGAPGGPNGPSSSPDSLTLAVRRATDLRALANRLDVPRRAVRQPVGPGLVDVRVPDGVDPEELRDRAIDDPAVLAADVVPAAVTTETPDDPDYRRHQWGLVAVNPEAIWDLRSLQAPDDDLSVLVLDTGVDDDHPDLDVDELIGADAGRTHDCKGHGTHVSGITAGHSDNDQGIASAPWSQPITVVRVLCGDGLSTDSGLFEALDRAGLRRTEPGGYDFTVDESGDRVVVNGSYCSTADGQTCDLDRGQRTVEALLLRQGFESGRVLWVFSTGNQSADRIGWPARNPFTLAVGSVDRARGGGAGDRSDFSDYGPGLDLMAPGRDIYSTVPDGYSDAYSGTSMASPQVASIATALWKQEPLLTSQQVMKRLLASGGEPWSEETGYGTVDMEAAFTLDETPPTVELEPVSDARRVAFDLRVLDDMDDHDLDPIEEETVDAGGDEETWSLDFGEVPTSAIVAVRWSVDGGRWHAVDIPADDVQRWDEGDGDPCQVCDRIVIDPSELTLGLDHRLTVRAWDSSLKVGEGPRFGQDVIEFETPGNVDRSEGSATVLVIDGSGSMGEGFIGGTKLSSARRAALDIIDLVGQGEDLSTANQLAVISFSDTPTTVSGFGEPASDAATAVDALRAGGGTDIGAAIEAGVDLAAGASGSRSIILLSDGLATSGEDNQGILAGPVARAVAEGVVVHTVAFGSASASDFDFLAQVSEATGGQASVAETPAALQTQFLVAQHETSGVVLAQTRDETVELAIPRNAAVLRLTALDEEQLGTSVTLTSPNGTDFTGDLQASGPSSARVGSLVVPDPAEGVWTAEADAPVLFIASAQPQPDAGAGAQLEAPRDPDPPEIESTSLAVEEAQAALDDDRGVLLAWTVVLAGIVLTSSGAAGRGSRRRLLRAGRGRREGTCTQCREPVETDVTSCEVCGAPTDRHLQAKVVKGPDRGRRLTLRPGDVLGGDRPAHHVLADRELSARHAAVVWSGAGWQLQAFDAAARVVDPEETDEPPGLRSGAVIDLGTTRIRITGEEGQGP